MKVFARQGLAARLGVAVVASMALPQLAEAHHPMGGATPSTLMEGLLSGFGHPVLGPDHLAFIVGVGILMAASRRWALLPVAFVAPLVPGVLAHVAGVGIGASEVYVALSVALLGAALLAERALPASIGFAAVALAGFCHGYAFGEAIVGAEATPLIAYLAGLSVMLTALMTGIALGVRALADSGWVTGQRMRAAAAVVLIGAGGVLTMASLVG